ncbi:hypothetical protein CAPTEDRAFT_122982 [Capitella teleta]|uniref:Rad4 beta-hairpin domain-containing protein n=1 Tax=Capitella teleta TaxID=283909 RepID=R7U5F2_CAPTE|nr:hypothetical protein CAPTEDRAFT_122982 [Capitella teleta]|eukprot:ELT98355.1 hypothetical protein CAPTEDRAFT_122982 [Capitella teleta]
MILRRDLCLDRFTADLDWWAEVYLQSMKKWICVECVEGKVNYPREQEKKVTAPMAYVVSFDSDFAVKDITKKYAKNWMSYTRKLRVDEDWWKASLFSLKSWKTEREALEDAEIEASFIKQPLPTSISDYKNHPLYALRRHLLKFEALYPDTAVPVGFLKNKEPVYARECVKTLHSRQNWLKEARLVRIGEEPYKIVKARMTPRRAKVYDGKSEPMLEIFGFWQTEEYIPAPAHDGKVPRNEYGNVELFRPSMLPGGTVHLKGMPGLNRIARKLNIDCAAAMTGWSLHGGHNHPVMDGWVVCVEHKDVLLAAWDEEQEIAQEKEREKKEKRVYANWKLLIRSALVRERLKHRYETFKVILFSSFIFQFLTVKDSISLLF